MTILVSVKRVVNYNVKVRVKSDSGSVDIANVKMSMNLLTRSLPTPCPPNSNRQMLREKFASHTAYDLLEGIRREEARTDRIVAEAYTLVAARGEQFELTAADVARQEKGLTLEKIGRSTAGSSS